MTLRSEAATQAEAKNYRLASLRESALKIVHFTLSLTEHHFRQFWVPCKPTITEYWQEI